MPVKSPRPGDLEPIETASRDEIAALMGITDRDPRVTWVVKQERAKAWAVRVEIRAESERAA